MIIPMKDQKKECDRHVNELIAVCCPGAKPAEVLHEFYKDWDNYTAPCAESYFYEFILALETFLYFNYHADEKYFKYFRSERFFA